MAETMRTFVSGAMSGLMTRMKSMVRPASRATSSDLLA
jgi:hypothetical protein